jgi:flagellar hook assembly protein FlgD
MFEIIPNPFRANGGSTTFAFEHNQPNTELLVEIQIVNSAGALVKRIQKIVKTEGTRNIEIKWDGTSSEAIKNTSGVYYYKLTISPFRIPLIRNTIASGQIIIL